MMDDILIAFDNDPSTELRGFFESCADEAKQMCANNNRGYISLFPPQLTNSDLISKMDNIKVCIVAAHGKHDGIVNEEGEEFISTRTTNYALSGKFLYTISCSTAIDLLPHLLSIGMKLYVGPAEIPPRATFWIPFPWRKAAAFSAISKGIPV